MRRFYARRLTPWADRAVAGVMLAAHVPPFVLLGVLAAALAPLSRAITAFPVPRNGGEERSEVKALRADLARRGSGSQEHFVSQTRRKAVQRLAEIANRDAWKLVIEALEDPSPRVADEAQLVLGGVQDPKVLDDLLGPRGLRSRDELVRLRVAEALGRVAVGMDEPDVERALERALDDRDPLVRRTLFWSVERLAHGRRVRDHEGKLVAEAHRTARKDCDDGVRSAALRAWCALGDRSQDPQHLFESLADDSPAVRAAAADELAQFEGDEIVRRLARVAGDPAHFVRRTVVDSLARIGTRASLAALVDRLGQEERPRLKRIVRETLQRRTGMLYRDDPRPWRRYFERLPADWRAGADIPPPERDTKASAAFAGLPILSDRLAFVIDFSGSIWMERDDGRTRKEIVDTELEQALLRLPAEARFNLVPYSDEPKPWQDRLVQATPRNVRKAIEWFEACRIDGKGNAYDAILLALDDPEVDTIVLLTDGAPTGGHRWNVELMTELLGERNRTSGVCFDAVLVGVRGKIRESWQELCRSTGGQSVVVDW